MLAYFDCFSGISGDMTLGALVDLGVPAMMLKEEIAQMPLAGFDIEEKTVSRNGISAKKIDVIVDEGQPRRDYIQIKSLIEESRLKSTVKETSLKILDLIADAESKIHGSPKEKVHFHEVGGVDAIVDIVGTALGMDYLNIDKVVASKIPLGTGFTKSMHGIIPVPSPATLSILQGVPTYGSGIESELVTPTGAAIIRALAHAYKPMPEMLVEKIGYGSGTRIFESQPNLLRVAIGKPVEERPVISNNLIEDDVVVVETNIDDMNPEIFGFLMDKLLAAGALDVCWVPAQMKKCRPGTLVQVLCHENIKDDIIKTVLTETTSLGVRVGLAHRYMLKREIIEIETSFGKINVKRITGLDGRTHMVPEYEVCRKIALDHNLPIKVVYTNLLYELR